MIPFACILYLAVMLYSDILLYRHTWKYLFLEIFMDTSMTALRIIVQKGCPIAFGSFTQTETSFIITQLTYSVDR